MRCKNNLATITLLSLMLAGRPTGAEPLKPAVERAVRAATFEIVVPRIPEVDFIQYERPLPWDLVPYSVRTDQFHSIGSAFSIGRNQFVTAGHVFAQWMGSLYGEPRLRSANGKLHDIDQILKFSGHQDFVVFSVREPPEIKPLAVETRPEMNSEVHAIGNALGEGVVMRSGLLTSETPEQQDGRWQWYRFSAAASPGNSGGPLVDSEGRAIGVVVGASPAENLNFALPIALLLDAPKDQALVDSRTSYRLPIMPFGTTETIKVEMTLPMGLKDFSARMQQETNDFLDRLRAKLLSEHADRLFPRGDKSERMLHNSNSYRMPQLVLYGDDGEWSPQETYGDTTASLDHGGEVTAGTLAGAVLVRVQRPENQPLAGLVADSRLQMDLALKVLNWTRFIGTEGIRILSLGPADRDEKHADSYGRIWQLRTWRLDPLDHKAVALVLPVPDGIVALLRMVPTGQAERNIEELKLFANLIHLSYGGSLAQWREYLALEGMKAKTFDGIRIGYTANQKFSYRSPRFEIAFQTGLIDINDRSNLELDLAYFREGEATVWDVAGFHFSEHLVKPTSVVVRRKARVAASIGGKPFSEWTRMLRREAPFDGRPYLDEQYLHLRLRSVVGGPAAAPAIAAQEPARLYEVSMDLSSMPSPNEVSEMQKTLLAQFRLLE